MKKKKSPLRVMMVFSEVAPFAKTGGLADVGGALPVNVSGGSLGVGHLLDA